MDSILKGCSEEEIVYWGIQIQKKGLAESDQSFIGQIILDRAFLLGRVKLIAEALESQSNPPAEVARWAREAFNMVKTWEG